MPPYQTPQEEKKHRLGIFSNLTDLGIEERIEKSGLSRTSLNLCKEKDCTEPRQSGSSRCKNHSKN